MAIPQARKSDHISRLRQADSKLLAALNEMRALRVEWDALGLASEIKDGDAEKDIASDFVGENDGLTIAEITAVYTSLAAIDDLLKQGHATNLYKAAA